MQIAAHNLQLNLVQRAPLRSPDQQALDLEIFIDHSLCEIFVNGGEHVLTLRFFAEAGNKQIALTSPTEAALNYRGTFWKLKSI